MNNRLHIVLFLIVIILSGSAIGITAEKFDPQDPEFALKLVSEVEKKYQDDGFTANFWQESYLKALDIRDPASGRALFKKPGKMRWIYETPEKQLIITDGNLLWAYRPDDNQVTVGNAPDIFGDGQGAGFLADIQMIRSRFNVTYHGLDAQNRFVLNLVPKNEQADIGRIFVSISDEYLVERIVTVNIHDDETIIEFSGIQFRNDLDDSLFTFTPPEGTDIIKIDEEEK